MATIDFENIDSELIEDCMSEEGYTYDNNDIKDVLEELKSRQKYWRKDAIEEEIDDLYNKLEVFIDDESHLNGNNIALILIKLANKYLSISYE